MNEAGGPSAEAPADGVDADPAPDDGNASPTPGAPADTAPRLGPRMLGAVVPLPLPKSPTTPGDGSDAPVLPEVESPKV